MKVPNKIISSILAIGIITSTSLAYQSTNVSKTSQESIGTSETTEISKEQSKTPQQVNIHMGDDASTQVNISYTTIAGELETKVELNKVGYSKKIIVKGENTIGNADKYFHSITVNNLEPNTKYEYTGCPPYCTSNSISSYSASRLFASFSASSSLTSAP